MWIHRIKVTFLTLFCGALLLLGMSQLITYYNTNYDTPEQADTQLEEIPCYSVVIYGYRLNIPKIEIFK